MLKVINIACSAILAMLLTVSCNSQHINYISIEGAMLGTTLHITAQMAESSRPEVIKKAKELDTQMKREMSLFDKSSLLSQINRSETDSTTRWIRENIRLADSISQLSDGIYDITVAPLVKAWGFGGGGGEELLHNGESPKVNIDSILQFVGYKGITIVDNRIVKRDPRVQIDLNSIAKGYAVDQMAKILEEMGAENYMVDIGGELHTAGLNPSGEGWRIGIESPIDGNMTDGEFLQQRLQIDPQTPLRGMATSGNYRRFYRTKSGEKVVHTINPKSGRATSSSLLSVTVLAPSCAEADALATMLLAAGDSEAERLANEIEKCEVYLIYNNKEPREGESEYKIYYSPGVEKMLLDNVN